MVPYNRYYWNVYFLRIFLTYPHWLFNRVTELKWNDVNFFVYLILSYRRILAIINFSLYFTHVLNFYFELLSHISFTLYRIKVFKLTNIWLIASIKSISLKMPIATWNGSCQKSINRGQVNTRLLKYMSIILHYELFVLIFLHKTQICFLLLWKTLSLCGLDVVLSCRGIYFRNQIKYFYSWLLIFALFCAKYDNITARDH